MTVNFVSRADLRMPPPVCPLTPRTHPTYGLTWHWTGADGTLFKPNPVERLIGIYDYHTTHGYCDIAYNGAFDADGNVYGLRDSLHVSAHAKSDNNVANIYTDGIVFLEDKRGMTQAGLEAMHWWINLFVYTHHAQPLQFGHTWWKNVGGITTVCPGLLIPIVKMLGGHA